MILELDNVPPQTPPFPPLSKNEMLIFGLRSTSDDWMSNLSNESQQKCEKWPPNENEMKKLDLKQGDILVLGNILLHVDHSDYTETDINIQMVKISYGC